MANTGHIEQVLGFVSTNGRICRNRKTGQQWLGADVRRAGSALSAGAESDTRAASIAGAVKGFTVLLLFFFFEQFSDSQWNRSNRAYIITRGVSGIDWKHYKHPRLKNVYEVYMKCWVTVFCPRNMIGKSVDWRFYKSPRPPLSTYMTCICKAKPISLDSYYNK
jgi:hypothetical protein